jgi:hypothetical protein
VNFILQQVLAAIIGVLSTLMGALFFINPPLEALPI